MKNYFKFFIQQSLRAILSLDGLILLYPDNTSSMFQSFLN